MGRSALDAAELMNVGVNYLREHVPDDVRMHYTYTNTAGAANIVPDIAATNYFIRSIKRSRTEDVSRRVDDCARGAAMMTGTTVDIELVTSNWEMKTNRPLAEAFYQAMVKTPLPEYTQEELYIMKLEVNGLTFDICVPVKEVMGEPAVGRRFKGEVWMQGRINF